MKFASYRGGRIELKRKIQEKELMDMDISVVIAREREDRGRGVEEGEGGINADGWRLDLRW